MQAEKKNLQHDVQNLQSSLNNIKLSISNMKNNPNFVKIGHLEQDIKATKSKILSHSKVESNISELKAQEAKKQSELSLIDLDIQETNNQIKEIKLLIESKNNEKIAAIKNQTELQNEPKHIQEELEILSNNNIDKELAIKQEELLELTKELTSLTEDKQDYNFLLAKSEQTKENLQKQLKELEESHNEELHNQLSLTLAEKKDEKERTLEKFAKLRKEKENFFTDIIKIKDEIAKINEDVQEKKHIIKEKQEVINEIDDDLMLIYMDNESYQEIDNIIKTSANNPVINHEQLQNLKNEINALKKSIETNRNNYENGHKTLNKRILQMKTSTVSLNEEIDSILLRNIKNIGA